MGLSMAIATLVGQNIGAGNIKRASDTARVGTLFSFGLMTLIGIVSYIFAPQFIGFFIPNDIAVIQAGALFVRIMALTFGFTGIQFALIGVFRASGNMMTTMVITLISQWVLQLPLAYFLSRHTGLGISGLWWAFPVTNVLTAIITLVWFMK